MTATQSKGSLSPQDLQKVKRMTSKLLDSYQKESVALMRSGIDPAMYPEVCFRSVLSFAMNVLHIHQSALDKMNKDLGLTEKLSWKGNYYDGYVDLFCAQMVAGTFSKFNRDE